ncbi:hypothetical protein C5167_008796, partial [Papaver somniferum]
MPSGRRNPPEEDPAITGKLRQSLSAVKDLVKVIKPIGLTDRAQRYLRRAAYGKIVLMYYNEYNEAVPSTTRQISTNKHGVVKLLNCFDIDCVTPCSFKFADDNFIESTPFFTDIKSTTHQTTVTKKNIIEKIKQLMNDINFKERRIKVDEKNLYLSIVETYETVLKVLWPDLIHEHLFEEIHTNVGCMPNVKACVQYLLILFAEHTPEGLTQKVVNHEQDIPRVG